jgi:hypothetical protein
MPFRCMRLYSPMDKPEEVEIRRAPKVLPFALTGAVMGVALSGLLYLAIDPANRSSENLFGLLLVSLGSLGLGVGVGVAIFTDIVSAKRVRRAQAVRSEGQSADR